MKAAILSIKENDDTAELHLTKSLNIDKEGHKSV